MQRDFATAKGSDSEKMRAKILRMVELAYERLAAKSPLEDADKQIAAILPRLLIYAETLERSTGRWRVFLQIGDCQLKG